MTFKKGDIFHSTNFPSIDHGKFFVVLGQNATHIIGAFFINSNIRGFLLSKPRLLELQVGLSPDEYAFLTHNSYLDCSQVIKIPSAVLLADIQAGVATRRGSLHPKDLELVLNLVRDSKVFSPADQEFFK
ncbi:MAG: hypothetical protein J6Y32_07880 [Bacteroidales bacterium]|nr:hypothetical protein [Bacteroidales bacterium]